MRKFFARSLSVVMALIMVLSMSASAQSTRMTVNLDTPEGAFDAQLIMGIDNDGCEQYILSGAALGQFLLQTDGLSLTVGSDESGYITVDKEALRQALTAAMYAIAGELPIDNVFTILNYITGPQFEADAEAVAQVLAVEMNRFATVASNMGLVTISENGDLSVVATYEQMTLLFAGYLKSLSQDTAVISEMTGLGLFEVMEVELTGAEEQIAAMIEAFASEIEASASYAQDGGLELYVYASGTMDGVIYTVDGDLTMKYELHYNENGMKAVASAEDGENFAKAELNANASGVVYTIDYSALGNVIDIDYTVNAEGVTATAKINADGLKGEGKLIDNEKETVIKGEATDGFSTLKVDCELDYESNEYEIEYEMKNRNTTEKFVFEYIDDELYLEHVATERGKTIKNVMITGSKAYRVNAVWNDGNYSYTITGTLRAKDGGITFDGDASVEAVYGMGTNINAEIEASFIGGVCTAEIIASTANGSSAEITITSGNGEFVFDVLPLENGKALGGLTLKLAENGSGYAGELKYSVLNSNGSIYQSVNAAVTLDANGLVINAEVTDYGAITLANIIIKDGLVDMTLTVDGAEIRYVYEYALTGDVLNIESAITLAMEGQTDAVEIYKYLLNMNLTTLVHKLSVNMNMGETGMYESAFDGETYTFVYDMDGQKVTLTGKRVEEADGSYILLEGEMDGMPITAKVGVKVVSDSETRLYAEAEAAGETMGAAIVMTTVQTNSSVGTTYSLEVSENGIVETLGSLNVVYEVLPETLTHVEGQVVTAEQLSQAIVSLIQSMMY